LYSYVIQFAINGDARAQGNLIGSIPAVVGMAMTGKAAKGNRTKNIVSDKKNIVNDVNGPTIEIEKIRGTKGRDGSISKHIIEKDMNNKTVSKTHQVINPEGKVIHQHQDHISTQKNPHTGKPNTRRFPDEWIKYKKIN